MYNIIFVCYGNICRSPMAEMIFKDLIYKNNKRYLMSCVSRATSCEEIGNDIYPDAKKILLENNVTIEKHCAKQITFEEYKKADYVIVMEKKNKNDLFSLYGERENVYLLLDFIEDSHDIEDPWYSGNFKKVYYEIEEGCWAFFNYLIGNGDKNGK